MSNALDTLLATLQSAASPADSALAVADFATAKSPDMGRALMAAAIPHWFTLETLTALLDEDLRPRAAELYAKLLKLPMVEEYPEREAHAVHDQTRLALRDRLWRDDPERFKMLSLRAASAYGSADDTAPDFVLTCEHLYHQLAGQTDDGDAAVALIAGNWRARFRTERLQILARLVEELVATSPADPPLLPRGRGLGHQTIADARWDHQPMPITVAQLHKAEQCFRSLTTSDPTNAAWQRDLSISLNRLGDLAVAQGDLAEALRCFSGGETIAKSLAASDPANAQWQHDLSVSLYNLGNLAVKQGDLAGALRSFTEAKTIAERLAASDLANAEWQRDLPVLLYNLGNIAVALGDLAGTKRSFSESKTLFERLAASDPANAQWQRDLSVSLVRLGDLAVAQGDLAEASRSFSESKTLFERLAASDPANAQWQRDLSVSLIKLGELAAAQGDQTGAKRCFTESETIAERLAASDPTNARWQRDLAVLLNKLGDLAVAQGDLAEALRFYNESKTIRERLADSDPANAAWQRDLWVSFWRLADHCEKSGQAVEAKTWWQKAFDTLSGMKERGLHVSPEDLGFLERLRAKVGK